ncbi:hypothetical protein GGR53DRAFT_530495 [Hypoxylon sp. FL1150]|nr:hypothetical protein GGR53DRAFT_530495 [Hypoxylon sp. FL1150]
MTRDLLRCEFNSNKNLYCHACRALHDANAFFRSNSWRRNEPGERQACFETIRIECRDPAHKYCVDQGVPAYPQVLLWEAVHNPDLVVLDLRTHGDLDVSRVPVSNAEPGRTCDYSDAHGVNRKNSPSHLCIYCDGIWETHRRYRCGWNGERSVKVYLKYRNGRINPTHEWLHAMDPGTYERPTKVAPLCRN